MMMSEINDADRRLLVCVAVAMEPEPWGLGWGRGLQDPLALCGQGSGRRKWGGDMVGDRSGGTLKYPATSCLRRKGLCCSVA